MTIFKGTKWDKKAPISLAPQPTSWDQGATGMANRVGLEAEDAAEVDPVTGVRSNPNGVKRMRRVDMLEVWHRKAVITTAGFNAAVALRDAFEAVGKSRGWPDSERVQSSPKPDHAVAVQIDRMSKFIQYHRHVVAEDREIIDACVLRGGSPLRIKRYRGSGYQAGLDHLCAALDRLADAMAGIAGR